MAARNEPAGDANTFVVTRVYDAPCARLEGVDGGSSASSSGGGRKASRCSRALSTSGRAGLPLQHARARGRCDGRYVGQVRIPRDRPHRAARLCHVVFRPRRQHGSSSIQRGLSAGSDVDVDVRGERRPDDTDHARRSAQRDRRRAQVLRWHVPVDAAGLEGNPRPGWRNIWRRVERLPLEGVTAIQLRRSTGRSYSAVFLRYGPGSLDCFRSDWRRTNVGGRGGGFATPRVVSNEPRTK